MSKVELTPAKLADIKKKAEAAETQGPSPWEFVKTVEENHIYFEVRDNDDCQLVTQEEAEHIAEANPATVLAMVQEIESLQIALRRALYQLRKAYRKESEAGQ